MKVGDQFDLEDKIKEVVSKDEIIPELIKVKTGLAYEEVRKMSIHKKNKRKKSWIVAASLIAATIAVGQTPLMADIKALFFGGYYGGVEQALEKEENQFQVGEVSQSSGITLEVESALIDPTVIYLKLNLKAENPSLLKSMKRNKYSGWFGDQFNIVDDQGRVIQEIREDGVYAPPHIDKEGNEIHLLSSSSEQIDVSRLDEGVVQVDMILLSSQGNYKDIKGLTLTSNNLGNVKGEWKLEVDLEESIGVEESATYEEAKPNPYIELVSAEAMKTGVKVDCIIKVPVDESVINSQLIAEDGTVFSTGRGGSMEKVSEGEQVVLTFEVLEEEVGESFTLKIPTIDGEEELLLKKKMKE